MEQLRRASGGEVPADDKQLYSFADLFKAIRVEDFSSYISKVRWGPPGRQARTQKCATEHCGLCQRLLSGSMDAVA
jgi:hypothetical protein